MSDNSLYEASAWIIPVLLAITLHEAAHGFAAWLLGDETAKRAGRISLNPLRHVDRFGTVVLPGLLMLAHSPVLFGYAKPVPVNFGALQPPRVGAILVAAAGPAMNILLAFISALLLHIPTGIPWLTLNLMYSVQINAVLAVFNLLPILPLDGGRVAAALLPARLERPFRKSETYGMVIVFVLLLLPALIRINPLGTYLAWGSRSVTHAVMRVAR